MKIEKFLRRVWCCFIISWIVPIDILVVGKETAWRDFKDMWSSEEYW